MSAPAIVIRLEIESSPVVYADVVSESEERRLGDWLASHPEQAELVRLAETMREAA
jgi:hypothetical protein